MRIYCLEPRTLRKAGEVDQVLDVAWCDLKSGSTGVCDSRHLPRLLSARGVEAVVAFDAGRLPAAGLGSDVLLIDAYAELRARDGSAPLPEGLSGAFLPREGRDPLGPVARETRRTDDDPSAVRAGVTAIANYATAEFDARVRRGAFVRGRYSLSCGEIRNRGIPINVGLLQKLVAERRAIASALIGSLGPMRKALLGGEFSEERFVWAATKEGLAPDEIPAARARVKGVVNALHRLRVCAKALGADGRLRSSLHPFGTRSGRCAPRGDFIGTWPAWAQKTLVAPKPGTVLVHVDISGADVGLAAAMSGDENMLCDYHSADVYTSFSNRLGVDRDTAKVVLLGTQYGLGIKRLAKKLKCGRADAEELIRRHKRQHQAFWRWGQELEIEAANRGKLCLPLGWTSTFREQDSPGQIRAFAVQGTGAEIVSLVVAAASRRRISIVGSFHDALMIESPEGSAAQARQELESLFAQAASEVVPGCRLKLRTTMVSAKEPWVLTKAEDEIRKQVLEAVGRV